MALPKLVKKFAEDTLEALKDTGKKSPVTVLGDALLNYHNAQIDADADDLVDELQRIPKLDNATPEFLADELGEVRKIKSAMEKREGILKEALKARTDSTSVEGDKYTASITQQSRTDIDREKLKELYGDEWYAQHCKTITYPVIRTKRND